MTAIDRPYVLLSAAVSLDGFLDDTRPARLLLSNEADFARVDSVRASVDAILVGANTLRTDDPRLLVRSESLRAARVAAGKPSSPLRVTLSASGALSPSLQFFTLAGEQLAFVSSSGFAAARLALGSSASLVDAGDPLSLPFVLSSLAERGVSRLMVEGGGAVHTLFLASGFVDEVQLAVAPFLLGGSGGARFVQPSSGPVPLSLASVSSLGEVVVLRYLVGRSRE